MSQFLRDDFDRFHDYGCLIKQRIVYFASECYDDDFWGETGVDFASAAKVIKNLLYLDQKNDNPIIMHYNSPGGDWDRGISVYDCIKGLRSPVTMVGYGCVRSMGTVIMQACKRRLLTPSCRFMIHDGYWGFMGTSEDGKINARENQWTSDKMHSIYLEKMVEKDLSITMQDIEDMCRNDNYMSGEEAVELGLADEVLK